jgi:4-carboxymuconolactone decarboxylase
MRQEDSKEKAIIQDGIEVHSLHKGYDEEFANNPYETPYRLHRDGFSEEFLEDSLKSVQHKLFGEWGLIGEKGGNNSYADCCSVYIFGQMYGRGVLTTKTRGLMVLAGLSVLMRGNVVPTWANACLNLGWTEDQLKELGALVSHIGGFPPSRGALMTFDNVFEKRHASE